MFRNNYVLVLTGNEKNDMKANEVRIGNYVSMDTATGGWWVDHKVTAFDFNVSAAGTLLIEACEPIPLTEEWLKKLGFEHEGEIVGRLQLDCDFGEVLIPLKNTLEICKYVHQLQNLYIV